MPRITGIKAAFIQASAQGREKYLSSGVFSLVCLETESLLQALFLPGLELVVKVWFTFSFILTFRFWIQLKIGCGELPNTCIFFISKVPRAGYSLTTAANL